MLSLGFGDQSGQVNIKPPGSLLPGGFCSLSHGMKHKNEETWCQSHLADQQLHQLLEKVDADLAEEACQQGCLYCEGKLHRADYDRKPRGGPQWERSPQETHRLRGSPSPAIFLSTTKPPNGPIFLLSAHLANRYMWLGTSTRRKGVAILLRTTDSHGRRAIVKILHEVSRKEEIQSPVHSDSNLLLDTWELE